MIKKDFEDEIDLTQLMQGGALAFLKKKTAPYLWVRNGMTTQYETTPSLAPNFNLLVCLPWLWVRVQMLSQIKQRNCNSSPRVTTWSRFDSGSHHLHTIALCSSFDCTSVTIRWEEAVWCRAKFVFFNPCLSCVHSSVIRSCYLFNVSGEKKTIFG